jgi:hypothetical protein
MCHHFSVGRCSVVVAVSVVSFVVIFRLDYCSGVVVLCFVDFSVRGIFYVPDTAEGCSDDVSVFPCFVTAVVTMFTCFC